MASDDNDIRLIDEKCPVRPYVIKKGLENCSNCENYFCSKLKGRIVSGEEIEKSVGKKIPEKDYIRFIKSYENKKRLDKMRESK